MPCLFQRIRAALDALLSSPVEIAYLQTSEASSDDRQTGPDLENPLRRAPQFLRPFTARIQPVARLKLQYEARNSVSCTRDL